MPELTFPPKDLESIRHDRFRHPHPRVQLRMEVLWLKSRGLPHEEIASLAGTSLRSVQRFLAEYRRGGLDRVRALNWRGKPNELAPHRETLEAHFLEHPPRSVAEAQAAVERIAGVSCGPTQVRAFLKKRLGLRYRKVGTVPSRADHDEQAAFLEGELGPRLEEAKRGERNVLFVDAAHFVYGPFLGYLWCLVRLFVPGPSGRKRYNVLGALDAVTHRMIRVSNHAYINAPSVCDLLKEVSRAGLVGPVTLVLDNAAYQRCAFVQAYAAFLGVELLYLPPYSPNLNLIERVWRFVKKEVLAARVRGDYGAFTAAIDDCLDGLHTKHKGQMDTLLTLRFQLFRDVPVLSA